MTLLLLSSLAHAGSEAPVCPAVAPPPATSQVAWISPVRRRVRARQHMTVVRVDQLADFVQNNSASQARLLQALDIVGPRAGWRARRHYKVTLFEVQAGDLCRPAEGSYEGQDLGGVLSCGESRPKAPCGQAIDSLTGQPTLDLYQVRWRDAARWGFAVVPLELYLQEME